MMADSTPESTHAGRMTRFREAGLYLVTSEALSGGRRTVDVVREALAGGVKLVQLREKDRPVRELLAMAIELRRMTREADAVLIINDRVDVALASEADGVHLGQSDFPVSAARQIAPDLIIGASSHCLEEALGAEREGASYVNIGPLFPTRTKDWQGDFLGLAGLRSIAPHVGVPFTVMGGIKPRHVPELLQAGAGTIALVTAVTAAESPRAATEELLRLIHQGCPQQEHAAKGHSEL
jgi:thiamine-phosphate pyrophosphorylase